MSSVGLSDIPRTTSFRLALLFLGLFGAASLTLFGFMYWQTAGYVSRGVDAWLKNEMASRVATHSSERLQQLNERAALDPDGHRPMALFVQGGQWLAGTPATLPSPLPPMDQPFDFTLPRGGEVAPFRGTLHRLASGDILLVAQDMREIHQFGDLLLGAMASGGLVVLVLGMTGAAIVGAGALGRIDGVTRAIEHVIEGDLSKRLPSRGTSGDLNRLIHVVNRMLDEIERLIHQVKGVTDDIAHDLRTPLTRLLAGLERVHRRGGTAEEYGAAVEDAIAETHGILVTFGALLRIAEVEGRARRAGFMLLDLNRVAADAADFYEPLAERKGIALSLEIAPGAGDDAGRPEPVVRGNRQYGRQCHQVHASGRAGGTAGYRRRRSPRFRGQRQRTGHSIGGARRRPAPFPPRRKKPSYPRLRPRSQPGRGCREASRAEARDRGRRARLPRQVVARAKRRSAASDRTRNVHLGWPPDLPRPSH